MAYGRQDYWRGVAPEKSLFGEGQTAVMQMDTDTITAGASNTINYYVVPAGYKLHITAFFVSCNIPGYMDCKLQMGATGYLYVYFDSVYAFPITEVSTFPVEAGGEVYALMKNYSAINGLFSGNMVGYLEQVIP